MSEFVATNGAQPTVNQTIINNGFFPDLSLQAFTETMRVDQAITSIRKIAALNEALGKTNEEFAAWQERCAAEGFRTLAAFPSITYGNETQHQRWYQQAVFHWAKSLLIEAYRDYDSTREGHNRADEMDSRIVDHQKHYKEAVRHFLGKPRSTICLI